VISSPATFLVLKPAILRARSFMLASTAAGSELAACGVDLPDASDML
jgi:hypothetical protein